MDVRGASLLSTVIAAHGGIERWSDVHQLSLRIRIRGNILALRCKSPRTRALSVRVDTHRIGLSLTPFPRTGMIGHFDEREVRIEAAGSEGIVSQREHVRPLSEAQIRHRGVWDDLDLLYFLGYALWNYSVTPFLFLWPGFESHEGPLLHERDGSTLRSLHVRYPSAFPTHSRKQTFYFDDAGLLRRLDYSADVFSPRARAAHYCEWHRPFDGLIFPTHRVVFARTSSGRPLRLLPLMEGWIDDVAAV